MSEYESEVEIYDTENLINEEVNFTDRVGFMQDNILGESKKTDILNPVERLKGFISSVSNTMKEQNGIHIKKSDVITINSFVDSLPSPEFYNATGLVLGYWVLNEGIIDKEKFKELIPKLPKIEYPIQQWDVIRYANLWRKYKCNM